MDPRLTPAGRTGVVRPLADLPPGRPAATAPTDGQAFRAQLDRAAGLRFSAHAEARLASRGVSFDSGQLARLQAGVDAAAAKGSREALVLVDDVAMVIAVRNRTVVTAVPRGEATPDVFTNIDAAVIT